MVESIDKKPFSICAIGGKPAEFVGFDPAVDQPRNTYLVKYDVNAMGTKMPVFWVIETDRDDCPVLPVRVRYETTLFRPVFKLKEFSANLGRIDPGSSTEIEFEMEDPGEPIITAAADTKDARAELVSTEKRENLLVAKVRVTPRRTSRASSTSRCRSTPPARSSRWMPSESFGPPTRDAAGPPPRPRPTDTALRSPRRYRMPLFTGGIPWLS